MRCFCVAFGKNFPIFSDLGVVLSFAADLWDSSEYEVDRLYEALSVNLVPIPWNPNVMNSHRG